MCAVCLRHFVFMGKSFSSNIGLATVSFFSSLAYARILKEVSVLLEALEKRQFELESENKELRDDLGKAANMIEDSDAARKVLEQKLVEKDVQLAEKKDIVFVEHSG